MTNNYRLDPAERAAVNGWADAAMPTGVMDGSRVGKRREDWVLGKMAEVAVCKALNVSPDFTNHADPGCDLDWCNCRLDVKATAHWHGNLVVAGDVMPGECDIFQACHVDINSNLVTIWGWQLAAVVFDDADRITNILGNGVDRSYLKYPRRKLRPGVPAGWDMVIATRREFQSKDS